MSLSERDMGVLRRAWELTEGKAWEPANPLHPFFDRAIAAGYVRRVDGRCGFELIRDAMVAWTDAGRAAMASV